MDLYGHIVTLYNNSQNDINDVKKLITDLEFPFEVIENTFFVGTSSIKKSKTLQTELFKMTIKFTFFFLFNADGSILKGSNIDDDTLNSINNIFFGN